MLHKSCHSEREVRLGRAEVEESHTTVLYIMFLGMRSLDSFLARDGMRKVS